MAKKFIYAVKKGRRPGIYTTWDACKAEVNGYPNAIFCKFKTKSEADAYMSTTPPISVRNNKTASPTIINSPAQLIPHQEASQGITLP